MTIPRTWHMYADLGERPNGETFWRHIYANRRLVMFCGYEPVKITLTEDPDGEYLGRLDSRDGVLDDSSVAMVQLAWLFPAQFVYGVQAEVDRGKGQVVRLRIEPTSED